MVLAVCRRANRVENKGNLFSSKQKKRNQCRFSNQLLWLNSEFLRVSKYRTNYYPQRRLFRQNFEPRKSEIKIPVRREGNTYCLKVQRIHEQILSPVCTRVAVEIQISTRDLWKIIRACSLARISPILLKPVNFHPEYNRSLLHRILPPCVVYIFSYVLVT